MESELGGPSTRDLDVVVGREREEEPDSVFLLARGIGIVGVYAAMLMTCDRAGPSHPVLAALTFAVSLFAAWFATRAPPVKTRARARRMKVRITPEAIELDDGRVERQKVVSTNYYPGEKPSVRCHDQYANIVFEALVKDEAEGRELVEMLGGDPSRKRTSFLIASPLGATVIRRLALIFGGYAVVLGAFFAMPKGLSGWTVAAIVVTLMLFPRLLMSAAGRIEVGTDGIVVRWFGTKRFVPYGAIEQVEKSGSMIRIARKGASSLVLNPVADAAGLDGIVARIEDARRARMLSGARVELEARLARGARSVATWREELERLEEHDGYRDPALSREDLWRIVEDASAPEDARLAAAVVLRRIDDAPRLRVAADAVASPKLRVALEALAEPELEDGEVEKRLASVVPEN